MIKTMATLYPVFFVFMFVSSLTKSVESNKNEKKLLDFILKDYDRRSRPVEDYNSPLNIGISIAVLQILEVDEKHQSITTRIWRNLRWNDYSLTWDPVNYGNISRVKMFKLSF